MWAYMIIIIESIVLCLLFTLMVYIMSRNPIKTLYNYPPKIQERVKSLDEYKDEIPTQKNKIFAKSFALILIIIFVSLILRYVNGYATFLEGFGYSLLLWTIINVYDIIVLTLYGFVMILILFLKEQKIWLKNTITIGSI